MHILQRLIQITRKYISISNWNAKFTTVRIVISKQILFTITEFKFLKMRQLLVLILFFTIEKGAMFVLIVPNDFMKRIPFYLVTIE